MSYPLTKNEQNRLMQFVITMIVVLALFGGILYMVYKAGYEDGIRQERKPELYHSAQDLTLG